ncbi:hypothetical protein E0W68_10925 [Flavobacterium salilacus subsp. salilacus]|uniref:contractile injection system tape measure protein n=1 Tax=Flavobacterium TaxID=237 RepID=UPI0010751C05|nr:MULTISPECIES: contractile injection system tape measure protein [Flavobacterium]KAF2517477.1 hypothetical protein E0W68_10925 [Flavobacterium salilacus subsp. salilacus]MBE1615621.1 hypothetical protein [Flavobacterium sp. SaA2.13]
MNKNHLISRFKWHTSFDNKNKGFEVQERLSAWSQNFMPGTITEVFDKMCPGEQTWRIPVLEVDLGTINFDNMEAEMALQLQIKLQELLSDMILYPANSSTKLDIYNENMSYLQLIATFLQHGFLPWTHKAEDGSINQIVANQLQNNRYETIKQLRELGVTHENIRKRMAWQLNDQNIVTIIEGLEPSYHKEIIDFSGELNKIQQKEIIVQADTRDFKKHVWLWILNYLLTENGSVFNRLAFAKSSIMQMASHYNISYEVLLNLIMEAVETVGKNHGIKTSFLLILTMLKEERTVKKQTKVILYKPDTDYWTVLEKNLRNLDVIKSEEEWRAFNDLLIKLEREDKQRLKQIITKASEKGIKWQLTNKYLNATALETVLGLYTDAADATTLTHTLNLIKQFCNELNIPISPEEIAVIGLQILTKHKNKTIGKKEFLNAVLIEVSKKTQTDISILLLQFVRAKTFTSERNIYTLQTYRHILESLSEKEVTQYLIQSQELEEIGALMSNLHSVSAIDKARFISLKKALIESINVQPEKMLEVLQTYPKQEQLLGWIPQLLNNNTMVKLVQSTNKKAADGITSVQRMATIIAKDKKYTLLEEVAATHLPAIGLELLITQKAFNPVAFITTLLKRFYNVLPQNQHLGFIGLVQRLYRERIITESTLQTLTAKHIITVTESPLEQVLELINMATNQKTAVSKILTDNFSNNDIAKLRKSGNREGEKVINYLLQGGSSLLNKLVKEYTILLSGYVKNKSENRLKEELRVLYWKCLLDYKSHRSNTTAFINNFKQTIAIRYPYKGTIPRLTSRQFSSKTGEKGLVLKDGTIISQGILIQLIEEGLRLGTTTIKHENRQYYFEELLELAIQWFPSDVRKAISSTVISKKSIDLLIQTTDFIHFNHFILQDKTGKAQETLETIISLYQLFTSIVNGTLSEKITRLYWTVSRKFITDNSLSKSELEKLVTDTLTLLSVEMTDIKERIAIKINTGEISVSASTKQLLSHHITIPVLLTKSSSIKVNGILLKYKRKGLLYDLAYSIIIHKQLPVALGTAKTKEVKTLLNELIVQHPHVFISVIKRELIPETQLQWLSETVDFRVLIKSISYLNNSNKNNLTMLQQLYYGMVNVTFTGTSVKALQELLFRKLIKVWASGNWKIISPGNLWNELLWECNIKLGIAPHIFIQQVSTNLSWLPPALRVSFRQVQQQYNESYTKKSEAKTHTITKTATNKLPESEKKLNDTVKEMIPVKNAGVVLLNSFIPMLFERLKLTENKRFINNTKQDEAVHYIQYLTTGLTHTEEHFLPLNKILCGLTLDEPVSDGITVSDSDKATITGLLKAAIGYWTSIGETSVNGFRGNWLVRDGLLYEQEDRWELTVEKRAYDLLIHKSPFSFSIIKYPWMDKPLHVNWNY